MLPVRSDFYDLNTSSRCLKGYWDSNVTSVRVRRTVVTTEWTFFRVELNFPSVFSENVLSSEGERSSCLSSTR